MSSDIQIHYRSIQYTEITRDSREDSHAGRYSWLDAGGRWAAGVSQRAGG